MLGSLWNNCFWKACPGTWKIRRGLGRASMDLSRTKRTWPACRESSDSYLPWLYTVYHNVFVARLERDGLNKWTTRLVANCLDCWVSEGCDQQPKFSWLLATSDNSQGTVLELIVFSAFTKGLCDGTGGQSTLSASSQKIPIWEKQLLCWRVVLILREKLMGIQEPHDIQQSPALWME